MHDTITRALPELDVEAGNRLGDEILLDSASMEKPKRVKGGSSDRRSFTSRAWTADGNVD